MLSETEQNKHLPQTNENPIMPPAPDIYKV